VLSNTPCHALVGAAV